VRVGRAQNGTYALVSLYAWNAGSERARES
jgi:hypothetical protein